MRQRNSPSTGGPWVFKVPPPAATFVVRDSMLSPDKARSGLDYIH